MRLINTSTRAFEEFIGSDIPEYDILSHTWEKKGEVTYKDYIEGQAQNMKGFHKIDMTCRLAESAGVSYAWVDTCCIDKSSSAELTEAINSMYAWYQKARVCYVYLSDMPAGADWKTTLPNCRWFTRGWTLQELIASRHVTFFDATWHRQPGDDGSDCKRKMARELSSITNIDMNLLGGGRQLASFCVAQKMSWAAGRETKRAEDMAYCLLGLFDLNMPLLYGEGGKAFQRLQETIIQSVADLSILAWDYSEKERRDGIPGSLNANLNMVTGVLATCPAEFASCGNFERRAGDIIREFSTSNVGIRIRTRMDSFERTDGSYFLILYLNCQSNNSRVYLWLRQVGPAQYIRYRTLKKNEEAVKVKGKTYPAEERILLTKLPAQHLPANDIVPLQELLRTLRANTVRFVLGADMVLSAARPPENYDHEDMLFSDSNGSHRDFGIIDVTWSTKFSYNGATFEKKLNYNIITLDWSDHFRMRDVGFGIVSSQKYEQSLDELKSEIQRDDGNKRTLLSLLEKRKVPRTKSCLSWLPGTDLVAILSVKQRAYSDSPSAGGICQDLKLEGRVCHAAEAPTVRKLRWRHKV